MPTRVPDWNAVLGLRPGASRDEILAAYRRLARACPPDAEGDHDLRLLTAARDHLLAASGQAARGRAPGPPAERRPGARPGPGYDRHRPDQDHRWAREDGTAGYRDRAWREPSPPEPYQDWPASRGSSRVGDLLVALPTPHRFRGWAAVFVAWIFIGIVVGALLGRDSVLGPLVEVCVFAMFALLLIAAGMKSELGHRFLDYLDDYRRRR